MKIVSDYFNFVTTVLSYHIKLKMYCIRYSRQFHLFISQGRPPPAPPAPNFMISGGGREHLTKFHNILSSPLLEKFRF